MMAAAGQAELAVPAFQRGVGIAESHKGQDSPDLAPSLGAYAAFLK